MNYNIVLIVKKQNLEKIMSDLTAFREEVRDWLEENCPPSMRTPMVPEEEVWGGRNAEYVNPESKL